MCPIGNVSRTHRHSGTRASGARMDHPWMSVDDAPVGNHPCPQVVGMEEVDQSTSLRRMFVVGELGMKTSVEEVWDLFLILGWGDPANFRYWRPVAVVAGGDGRREEECCCEDFVVVIGVFVKKCDATAVGGDAPM